MIDVIDAFIESINCKGILITDGKGVILEVESSFNENYAIGSRNLTGSSVYDLEREGLFRPSAVAKVLETGQKVTLIQQIRGGIEVVVTAFPVRDDNGVIIRVITFSREPSEYNSLKGWFDKLYAEISLYKKKVDKISDSNTIIDGFFTHNSHFEKILRNIQRLAKYDVSILLLGETGVGKTLVAKKIHMLSHYNKGRFVEVNCGTINHGLIETELFGYEKGSFTGADKTGKKGLFEIANNGTLFLDEIGELSLDAQVKLLKVLQDKKVRPVGATEDIKVNCRILAATNKNLEEAVTLNKFREDLLYRLNIATINILPLRKRKEDIFFLSQLFMNQFNEKYNEKKILTNSVIEYFNKYDWPGNVRELENIVHRMMLSSDEKLITEQLIPNYLKECIEKMETELSEKNIDVINDLESALESYEGMIIRKFYQKYRSSPSLAKALNISQTTALRKIRKYVK